MGEDIVVGASTPADLTPRSHATPQLLAILRNPRGGDRSGRQAAAPWGVRVGCRQSPTRRDPCSPRVASHCVLD